MSHKNGTSPFKRGVALIGTIILIANLILFGLQKITITTFFYIIAFFGALTFVYFKKEKKEN